MRSFLPLGLLFVVIVAISGGASALQDIQLTLVDPSATFYGTFQSHNQKVVSNANGIFITWLHDYVDPVCTWRMARSADGGTSFTTIYERSQGNGEHSSPVLETDEDANVYLAFSEYYTGRFYFLRFLSSEGYSTAHESIIEGADCAGKFAMAYDHVRRRFYIGLQYGGLFSVGMDGTLIDSTYYPWTPGWTQNTKGQPQYPHLHLDDAGTLYYAQTAMDSTGLLPSWAQYRSIHCIKSPDGGATWQNLAGETLSIPVNVDEDSPATMISDMEDLTRRSWLANMITKAGRTHFWYLRAEDADGTVNVIPYMNYDTLTGQRQNWQNLMDANTHMKLGGWDGFFATKDLKGDSALYLVSSDQSGRPACLVSHNNGETWYDHALASESHWPYATGGARSVTSDGYIIGTYTAATGPGGAHQIWFFKIYTTDDADGDGLTDAAEARDLDEHLPGCQNPFNPAIADSTGDDGQNSPDGMPDGTNDWDGDGMANADEFRWNFNPIDPESFGKLPASGAIGLAISAGLIILRKRNKSER